MFFDIYLQKIKIFDARVLVLKIIKFILKLLNFICFYELNNKIVEL